MRWQVCGDRSFDNISYTYNETELYYLQSRYYDPEVGRFINSDDVYYIGATDSEISYNPFAYCENDPVNDSDPMGCLSVDQIKACFQYIFESIRERVQKFIENNIGYISGNYLFVSTNLIANVIDGLIIVGSLLNAAIKQMIYKSLFKAIRDLARKNPQQFAKILKNPVLVFISRWIPETYALIFERVAGVFAFKVSIKMKKENIKNKLLNSFNVGVWISRLTSAGSLIAYIFSLVDGYNSDNYIRVKVRK